MNNRFFVLILFLLWLVGFNCTEARSNYYFKQISVEQGLSQSSVRCMLEDYKGFLWIGTRFGLNRFDHYDLKSYFYKSNDPASLPGNQIFFIAEDNDLNLWVSTNEGLALYNRNKDNFTPVLFNGKPFITHAFLKTKGGILFGGSGELFTYDSRNQELAKLPLVFPGKLFPRISQMAYLNNSTILCSSRWNGIWLYDVNRKTIKRAPFCAEKNIMAITVDPLKRIWVSPYGKGVFCYSEQGKLLYHYSTANSELNNDVILDIKCWGKQVWLATDGGGINILNTANRSFSHIRHVQGDIYSLPVNSIYCLYRDNEENIWAGSIRGGLMALREVYIRTYRDVPLGNPFGLSDKTAISIWQGTDETIWIGTDGGGVNNYNPRTNQFRHYPSTYGEKVVSIAGYSSSELLVSLFSKGLYVFNKQSGTLKALGSINQDINENVSGSGLSVNLLPGGKNRIYLLAKNVFSYDLSTKKISQIKYIDNKETGSLQGIYSNESASWAFSNKAIFRIDNKQNILQQVCTIRNHRLITDVCRDAMGNFWIGTSEGLSFYSIKKRVLTDIKTSLFSEVSAIVRDKKGHIWLSSQGMLFAYNIKEQKFILFGESDGAYPNEYLSKPTLLSHSGNIYIGGVTGLLQVDKDIPFQKAGQPKIELADLMLNGAPAYEKIDSEKGEISIPWNHNSLVLNCMAREKDVFRKKMFRYVIEGLDNHYIETYDHILTLRSLPAGKYRIMVSCNTRDGSWSEQTQLLKLTVTPPWWKSTWFTILVIILLLIGIRGAILLAIRRRENQLLKQMQEHEAQTQEEKIRFLINVSHELRTPLTLIHAPLKRMLDRMDTGDKLFGELSGIYKQTRRMKDIINMVLNIRRMEMGHEKISLKRYPLNEWLQSVATDFVSEFRAAGIDLKFDFSQQVGEVAFDEAKCRIVVSNLLMNALKYSEANTSVLLSTALVGSEEQPFVRVTVKDQGIGLRGVDVDKLFTRFYKGEHGSESSGIGLSYSRILIEVQGGKLVAKENEEQPGSSFYFELPLSAATEEKVTPSKPYLNELLQLPEEAKPNEAVYSTTSYSLLIVEDENELRNFLKESLKENFNRIYTASDGVKALEIISQMQPDIVVSDVMMPRMNGFELCRKIKENIEYSHIPVILLTARDDGESVLQGYKNGADVYLPKPFEIDFLLTVIGTTMQNREAVKSLYRKSTIVTLPEKTTFSNTDEKFLLKLNEVISDNLSEVDLDVTLLTEKLNISRASLYTKVKVLTGMAVGNYINKFRIERAVLLLTRTDLSVTEISEQTGFSSQRYFSTAFKQAMGCTPSQYKAEHKEEGGLLNI